MSASFDDPLPDEVWRDTRTGRAFVVRRRMVRLSAAWEEGAPEPPLTRTRYITIKYLDRDVSNVGVKALIGTGAIYEAGWDPERYVLVRERR